MARDKKGKVAPSSTIKPTSGLGFSTIGLWIFSGSLILLAITIALVKEAYASERLLMPLSLIALIAGLLLEYRRISKKWSTVLLTSAIAFLFSFLAFVPRGHGSNYILDEHIQVWPYFFCGIFVIGVIITHKRLVTAQLREEMTLMQTLALGYWLLDHGLFHEHTYFSLFVIGIFGLFALITALHAFLPLPLSRTSRSWLSVWSSLIMLFLAVDNTRRIYRMGYVEHTDDRLATVLILANHFLLGISSIYMAQNAMMLAGFLPGRGTFFNAKYFKEINDLRKDHIRRYSMEQAPFGLALICLLFTVGVFWSNDHFGWVRSNVAIWMVFLTFPWFLRGLAGWTSMRPSRTSHSRD